jgi:DNA-binding response OmpR family regulator
MLRQKIKLCVLHGCTPHDRAELLMAGFDDAIDVTRTDEQEAAARVLSILRRYTLAAEMDRIARGDELKLAQISDVGQLTKRQKATLLTMIASGDAPATYARLCNILSLDHEPMKLSSLKVFICTLRKRLRPGARIRSVSGVGYTLHLPA